MRLERTENRVLLVEDDASLCNLVRYELEKLGLEVSCTDSSVDAIMKLEHERFDVVLLDIMLTGSSGLYVVDVLRDLPSYERPRVVVITAARGTVLTNIDRSIVRAVFFKPLDLPSLGAYVVSLMQR